MRKIAFVLVAVVAFGVSLDAQRGRIRLPIRRAGPSASSPSPPGVITASDLQWMGYIRLERTTTSANGGNCNIGHTNYSGFGGTGRDVSGVVHFILLQGTESSQAPCEYASPSTWDGSGNCLSNCPSTTLSSSPTASLWRNWGYNNDGTFYDWRHGIVKKCWGQAVGDCYTIGSTLNYHGGSDGGSILWQAYYANGYLYLTGGSLYGNYEPGGGLYAVSLDNRDDGTGPVTHAYGPFIAQTHRGVNPSDTTPTTLGLTNALYLTTCADGTLCTGSAQPGAYQQGGAPGGPGLHGGASWPTSGTASAYTDRLDVPDTYLHYYGLDCVNEACSTPGFDMTGALNMGQAMWSFRKTASYVWDDPDVKQTNPRTNPAPYVGIGNWGQWDTAHTAIWINSGTKTGFLVFATMATNHSLAYTDNSCSNAHTWYDSGGAGVCPLHSCDDPYDVTGPTSTHGEPVWFVYNPANLQSVKSGSTTDYTVDPVGTIYPLDSYAGIDFGLSQLASPGPYRTQGAYFDSTNKILYVIQHGVDSTTYFGEYRTVVMVFKVTQ